MSGRRIPQELRGRVASRIRSTMTPFLKGDAHHMRTAAKDLGVSGPAIWFWYNGWCIPMVHNLIKFADYYEVSIDYLLGRTAVRELNLGKVQHIHSRRKAA